MIDPKLLDTLATAAPEDLRAAFDHLARLYSIKAEALYDKDPEANGLKAQPYADLADLCGEASTVFDAETEKPVDVDPELPQAPVLTVTAAVARQTGIDPWRNR